MPAGRDISGARAANTVEGNMKKIPVFSRDNYREYCSRLVEKDEKIEAVVHQYGYPQFRERQAGFEGLVRIILEQQVSLASALAVLKKLKMQVASVTPEHILSLDDGGFKAAGFSRQKQRYVRLLASEIIHGGLDLAALPLLPDEQVRNRLISVTGIGRWTCDTYLLLCLRRLDIFPAGDLALVKSMEENGFLKPAALKKEVEKNARHYRPYRSIFAVLMWHAYIKKRGMHPG